MNLSRVDLNLFVVFDAVYAEGGITAASQRLNLSQPAVSHALGRLRTQLGDPLFERKGRAMTPTPLANSLIAPVRAALRALEGTLQGRARFDPATSERRFTLAVRDLLELSIVPLMMARVSAATEAVEITTTRVDRRSLEADLFTGQTDLAVDVLLPVSPDVRHERLLVEPLVVTARRDHPTVGNTLGLEDYLALEHIQVSSRRRGPSLEDIELARLGLSRRIRLRCQQYSTASRTVSLSDMVATMPERFARMAGEIYGNRVIPLPVAGARMELHMYWHASTDDDPAGAWLRRILREAVAEGRTESLGTSNS